MTYSSPTPPNHAARQRRRRWPWITGAAVVAIFVLAGVLGANQQPQPASVPASDTGAIVTSTHTMPPPATTTTTVPVTTVAPVTTTVPHTTVKAVVVAPRTTAHHTVTHHTVAHPTVTHSPVAHRTTVHRAPTTTGAPAAGRYHAGEFCKTLGATAISSTGAAMTCIQEGDYKRWHND